MTRFPSIVHSIHTSSPPGEWRSFLSLLGNFVSRARPPPNQLLSRRNTDQSFSAVIKLFGMVWLRCVSVMAIGSRCEQSRFDRSESCRGAVIPLAFVRQSENKLHAIGNCLTREMPWLDWQMLWPEVAVFMPWAWTSAADTHRRADFVPKILDGRKRQDATLTFLSLQ